VSPFWTKDDTASFFYWTSLLLSLGSLVLWADEFFYFQEYWYSLGYAICGAVSWVLHIAVRRRYGTDH
jgi:hypothetical protein